MSNNFSDSFQVYSKNPTQPPMTNYYIPIIQDNGNIEMFKEYYLVILICLSYVNKYLVLIWLK